MLKVKVLCLIVFVISFHSSFGQGIIIDHTCTDVDLIPAAIIDNIKSECKFQWAATSHGHQPLTGLKLLEVDFPHLDVTVGDGETGPDTGGHLPDSSGTFCVMDGVTLLWANCGKCCLGIGPSAYWQGDDALASIDRTLKTCFPGINISGWGWCSELTSWTDSQVQEYLDQMNAYEQQYPNVKFIYSTGNAESDGIGGANRFQRNNQIRQYCIQNDKVLFDFADLECWSNGEMHYFLDNGDTIPLQHPDYSGNTHHHTNALNCINKGKAVWYMMARLQSWKPESIRLNIKLYLEGPFNGTVMNSNLNNDGYIPLSQPYNVSPWNYNGLENVPAIPNNYVIDWVLIELRHAATASFATSQNILIRRAAFLVNNGYIVDMDGSSNIIIESKFDDNLYAIIWHRNHLGIMSANPLSFDEGAYQYDFSISSAQAYGDSLAHAPITQVLWGLASGNGNADSVINMSDKTEIWQNQAGLNGYFMGDFNLDGQVNSIDKNENWIKNNGSGSQVPQ